MPLEPRHVATMPYLTRLNLAEQHPQPLSADRGTGASALHRLPRAVLRTSARAALAIIVLKIVPGLHLANTVLSPNGHLPLLLVPAASLGDRERFERVFVLFLAIVFTLSFTCLCFIKLGFWYWDFVFFFHNGGCPLC